MYKLISIEGKVVSVGKEENGIFYSIPFDPANTDYREYLKWIAEGNTPEPADEPQE